jgi:hypothetical protein
MAKTAKGKRPVYFEDPQVDKLLAMVIALTGEVSVLRERLDTLERLLETKDIVCAIRCVVNRGNQPVHNHTNPNLAIEAVELSVGCG